MRDMAMPAMKQLNPSDAASLSKLKSIKLFQQLDEESLQHIAASFYESRYDKETAIFYEQDLPSETGRRVYFILEGCIKLVKYSTDGESTIVRLATAGEFFGVTGALTNKPLPFSALAYTDTTLLTIREDHFRNVFSKYPALAMNMIVDLGEVLWFHYETHNQVVKKTDARVAKILLYHMERDGSTQTPSGLQINLMLPHSYIASMTGIAYEESVRIISRLRKQHECIQYLRGGKIIVTNLERLNALAEPNEIWGV
jgi:CRP-like cAMP-binding protein